MKIAIVIWDLTVSGGTQRQALELSQELSKSHSVEVYAYAHDPKQCYPKLSRRVKIFSLHKRMPVRKNRELGKIHSLFNEAYGQYHRDDKAIKELSAFLPGGFDILNYHDLNTEKVAYFYKRHHPSSKAVWMSNDVPILKNKEHYDTSPTSARSPQARVANLLRRLLLWISLNQERKIISALDHMVVLDGRNQRLFQGNFKKTPVIIRSGLDTASFRPRFKKNNEVFTVLAAGIFFRWRRFEDLISAAAILKKQGYGFRLNIIGSDRYDHAYYLELKEQVSHLALTDRVAFLGTVTEPELVANYQSADVFVFPNHNQTWGLAVFEALACGTPVIVSKSAGAHEVLDDGRNALLVDPLNPQEIAKKIALLIEQPELGQKLARNGHQLVKTDITWPLYAKNMLKVFENVLSQS